MPFVCFRLIDFGYDIFSGNGVYFLLFLRFFRLVNFSRKFIFYKLKDLVLRRVLNFSNYFLHDFTFTSNLETAAHNDISTIYESDSAQFLIRLYFTGYVFTTSCIWTFNFMNKIILSIIECNVSKFTITWLGNYFHFDFTDFSLACKI